MIWIEDVHLQTVAMAQSLRSGRHLGRKIMGVLMFMVVVSLFLKVLFLGSPAEEVKETGRSENRLLKLQTFKEDGAMAQRAVTEAQTETDADLHSMPKRVLEKVDVSVFHCSN